MASSSPEWQSRLFSFANRAKYILDNGEWSDCAFIFETDNPEIVKAHKLFLAMVSPVFESMFYGPLAENEIPIRITDIQPQDFKLFLQYVYTGSIELNCFEDARNVYCIAKKYMIPGLFRICVDRVWDFLSTKTVCHAYEFAVFSDDKELEEECLKIVSLYTLDVIKDPSFETIQVSTLEKILDMNNLNISSELDLYYALCRWAQFECSRRDQMGETVSLRSVVNSTLPKLRFLTLKPEDIANSIVGSELLNSTENYSILLNIISPNKVPMPSGFSTCTTLRNPALILKNIIRIANTQPLRTLPNLTKPMESMSKPIKFLPENGRYSWIRNVNVTQTVNGILEVTCIHFEVVRKIKILGVQMSPDREIKYLNSQYIGSNHYSWFGANTIHAVCIDLETGDGETVSKSHFRELNINSSENVKIDRDVHLERKKRYVLRIALFRSFADNSTEYKNASFENSHLFEFVNLPIQYIAFTY